MSGISIRSAGASAPSGALNKCLLMPIAMSRTSTTHSPTPQARACPFRSQSSKRKSPNKSGPEMHLPLLPPLPPGEGWGEAHQLLDSSFQPIESQFIHRKHLAYEVNSGAIPLSFRQRIQPDTGT